MKITAVRPARLLSLTDLFPFLPFSLYALRSADDVNGEKEKKCLDVVDACPSPKRENDEVHMYTDMHTWVQSSDRKHSK